MHRILRLFAAILFLKTLYAVELDLWMLQGPSDEIEIVNKAIQDDRKDSKIVDTGIQSLIDKKRLIELGRFHKATVEGSSEEIVFEKDTTALPGYIDGAETSGTSIKVSALARGSKMDCTFAISHLSKTKGAAFDVITAHFSSIVDHTDWQCLAGWERKEKSIILLGRLTGEGASQEQPIAPESFVRAEIRLCKLTDIEKFNKATADTRVKATEWLRKRGELAASVGCTNWSGQTTQITNRNVDFRDPEIPDNTVQAGLKLTHTQTIGPQRKLIDLDLICTWSDQAASNLKSAKLYHYRLQDTTHFDHWNLSMPEERDKSDLQPVLFIRAVGTKLPPTDTPKNRGVASQRADEVYVESYSVHPALQRRLMEKQGIATTRDGFILPYRPIEELLIREGVLGSQKGTSATFSPLRCEVLLTAPRESQLLMEKLIDDLDARVAAP